MISIVKLINLAAYLYTNGISAANMRNNHVQRMLYYKYRISGPSLHIIIGYMYVFEGENS